MKKVLIITYYWPPAGGPGVQRVLKFAKYLPEYGWMPIILTVNKGEYPSIDETLLDEIPDTIRVYKTYSLEPGFLYKKFTGMSDEEKIPTAVLAEKEPSFKKKIARWLRLNLFIPDAKIGWKPYAVSEGKKIIDKEKPDLIYSSSPPPTVHLIARKLKQYSSLRWIADFRDPWTDIHYYENLHKNSLSNKMDCRLEKAVLHECDKIVCVSQYDIDMDFGKKVSESKCINIANGYDEKDFDDIRQGVTDQRIFNFMHLGVVGIERCPNNLFKIIHELGEKKIISETDFQLTFVGKVETEVKHIIDKFKINKFVKYIPYLPHNEALKYSSQASALLLLITQSKKNIRILPGKTFEYMRIGIPIMALGPENGEVARIFNTLDYYKVIDYKNAREISKFLIQIYNIHKEGRNKALKPTREIEKYERKNLTKQLAAIFDNI